MRIVSPDYDILYTVWCSHEHEVYDMKVFHFPSVDFSLRYWY